MPLPPSSPSCDYVLSSQAVLVPLRRKKRNEPVISHIPLQRSARSCASVYGLSSKRTAFLVTVKYGWIRATDPFFGVFSQVLGVCYGEPEAKAKCDLLFQSSQFDDACA